MLTNKYFFVFLRQKHGLCCCFIVDDVIGSVPRVCIKEGQDSENAEYTPQ